MVINAHHMGLHIYKYKSYCDKLMVKKYHEGVISNWENKYAKCR